ncbi:hypothetical protein Ae201684P_020502 [Aphanomyces euteiches]|nr:hypothetical protein Ae201684P_020502 [Aphanomyces euteiches]
MEPTPTPTASPPGVTLDLTNLKDGAAVSFTGTTTFGTKLWEGPLVLLTGTNLQVTGPGTLDGQGAWYWKQGQSVTRPVFFRLTHVDQSTLTGFTLKNSPFRTFSILNSANTQLTGLTLDSSAGDGLAKNTDGFDLSRNNGVSITHNTIHSRRLSRHAIQHKHLFRIQTLGHGISIGSIGRAAVDISDTAQSLTVNSNTVNSANDVNFVVIELFMFNELTRGLN